MSGEIIITEHLDDAACDWLASRAPVRHVALDDPSLQTALSTAHGLIVRTYTQVDSALLEQSPCLKVVGRAGVGLDNVDVDACTARGIQVVHTPNANTQAVVEYVMSILAHMVRPLHAVTAATNSAQWAALRTAAMAPLQLSQLHLGLLGMGRIGQRVAQAAGALGMKVMYCDLLDIDEQHRHGATPVDQDRLLQASDVLSVHIDGRASNRHLLQASTLAMLKPTALLINTSRGFVIDHDQLAHLLADRPDMRAVLDVHDPEPVGADNSCLNLPNAMLLPHAASRTAAAQAAMSSVVRDVARVLGLPLD